jgi:hypothetical protein
MKLILSILLSHLLLASLASAAAPSRDSVAVFHRPHKVIVLVNEAGHNSRLQKLMEVLGGQNDILLLNSDQSIKIDCGRSETAVSCTFRFLPSASTQFGKRHVDAACSLADLRSSASQDLQVSFESAQQDRFMISITSGAVHFHAEKKVLKP